MVEYHENDYRRLLLLECVEAYMELDEEQQRVYQELLETERYKEIKPMMTTTFEKGVAQGLESARRMFRGQLERRFGPLSEAALQFINSLPPERLEELGIAFVNAKSLEELGLPG